MQSDELRLCRLAPELPAANLHAAIEYYSGRLGFLVAMQMDNYVIVERGGVAIHLFDDSSREHTPIGIHIFTPDLEALFAELETRGAIMAQRIEVKPWGNREFRVLDADKNELKFTEPIAEGSSTDRSILRGVPIFPVADLTRSIDFYGRLGFAARRYQDGDGYAFLSRDSFQLHLCRSDMLVRGHNPGSGVYFYLAPGSAASLEAEFRAAGAAIHSPLAPREWRMNEFVLADPDGNLLRFGEDLIV